MTRAQPRKTVYYEPELRRLEGELRLRQDPADAQNAQDEMAGRETVGKPAPELMAAGWIGSPVTLRSVKGNTVVLNFWNSDTTYFDSPEYFLKSMMTDYEKYSKTRNITFISICRSMTATMKQVERDIDQYKVHPLPTMLDAGTNTARPSSLSVRRDWRTKLSSIVPG